MKESWLLYSSLFILFLLLPFNLFLNDSKSNNLPPSPFALPILGHLHLLKPPLHRTLRDLSQKYGPIFSLKFGSQLVVVISSSSAAEECFSKYDLVLANRPRFTINKYITYNSTTLGSSSYGDHWRNLHQIVTLEVFSSKRLNMLTSLQRDELKILLRKLHDISADKFAKVELKPLILALATNTITRMIAGKRYYGEDMAGIEEARHARELIDDMFAKVAEPYPGDFLPIFKYLDTQGFEKKVNKLGREVDVLFQGLVDERRRNKGDLESGNTMIDHLLSLQESQPELYTDEIIKGLVLNMIAGGTQTMAAMIEWAMANLLNNLSKLKKARAELDAVSGSKQLLDETDLSKLHYLQNIISETFRLYPAVPLLIPHVSSDYFTIGGYDVPPKTILFFNAWAIQRDPKVWDDSISFSPERFDNSEVDPYKLLPFGVGMRQCPGNEFSKRIIGLTLGTLIQYFEWDRVNEKPIDLVEEPTGILMPKTLEVLCKTRSITKDVLIRDVL
ncbi:hypothetical protein REPUB_Repub10bG0136800 [Reevesia pubescens]